MIGMHGRQTRRYKNYPKVSVKLEIEIKIKIKPKIIPYQYVRSLRRMRLHHWINV